MIKKKAFLGLREPNVRYWPCNSGLLKERTIEYAMKCKCEGGGFCFYQLEEPNTSDTYYGLSILNLSGVDFRDDNTVDYLKNMQEEDGSYSSIYLAYYSIKGLLLLKEKPKYDPREYILKNVGIYNVDSLPKGILSIFKPMFYLVELCFGFKIKLDDNIKNKVVNFIFHFKKDDNGFGNNDSTLIETSQALSILNWLDYPIDSLEVEEFIKKCENPIYGFSNIPNTAPSFIEHIHAGAVASALLAYKPRYLNQCTKFIMECQNNNGGFSRSSHGISTLENTYYAVRSLLLLSALKRHEQNLSPS